jgi:hypothetical protein
MVEMHKKNALLTATKSTEQLVGRSGQVIVLKTFDRIYGYDIRSAAGTRAMTDRAQTQTFDEYCQLLREARGIPEAERQIADSEARAAEQIAFIAKDCAHLQPIFKRINARFTLAELAELRRRVPYGATTQSKLLDLMFDISRALFVSTGVPERRYPRINGHALHFFIFRYAMCIVLFYTRWVHVGQQERPEA